MKKIFYIRFYKFNKTLYASPKSVTAYYLSIQVFNKWFFDFRIGRQDGSFSIRNEQLHYYILKRKYKNITF